jgi:hypothetical protein
MLRLLSTGSNAVKYECGRTLLVMAPHNIEMI